MAADATSARDREGMAMTRATKLSDNRQPTAEEWRLARVLGAEIIAMADEREAVIESRGLDRAFCIADANWGPTSRNDYLNAYRLLRPLDWNEVRLLRFRCQIFSGWNMLHRDIVRLAIRATHPVPDDPELPPEPPDYLSAHWRVLTHDLPEHRRFRPPLALGELGWRHPDEPGIFSYEICVYQERITLLHRAGVLDRLASLGRPPSILEIGAGYGALATALTQALPSAHYTICDLPESMLFSGLYLNLAARRHVTPMRAIGRGFPAAVELVPNYLFSAIANSGRDYDLVINTLSMSEMSDYQIATYGHGIRRLLGDQGLFFDQNHNNRHVGLTDALDVLREIFPFGASIDTGELPITQGPARLWANRDPAELVPASGLLPLKEPTPLQTTAADPAPAAAAASR
jgi:SAM-dependent methyltransferase